MKSGTHRTFEKAKRTRRPAFDRAITGIRPIEVARDTCPLAWPKISSHGTTSTRRVQSAVQWAVQPESGAAENNGKPVNTLSCSPDTSASSSAT